MPVAVAVAALAISSHSPWQRQERQERQEQQGVARSGREWQGGVQRRPAARRPAARRPAARSSGSRGGAPPAPISKQPAPPPSFPGTGTPARPGFLQKKCASSSPLPPPPSGPGAWARGAERGGGDQGGGGGAHGGGWWVGAFFGNFRLKKVHFFAPWPAMSCSLQQMAMHYALPQVHHISS
jgi:hypothetical protein